MRLIPPLTALAAALALAGSASATVERGLVVPNEGAAGITLGMDRAQVMEELGSPLYENGRGFMQYSSRSVFDLYRFGNPAGRVDLIAIAGTSFCLRRGVCMLRRGNVRELERIYGKRLKFEERTGGTLCYRVSGRFEGRRSYTEFDVLTRSPWARVVLIWIGWIR